MSDSGLKLDSRTPEQARAERERKDREGWYPGTHPDGTYVIWSRTGRLVCNCVREADRDAILDAVRKAAQP